MKNTSLSASLGRRSMDGVADYLRHEFHSTRQFETNDNNKITVNLTGLTYKGRVLAVEALETWSDITGLTFQRTRSDAQITFDDGENGAFSTARIFQDEILSSKINVGKDWLKRYGTDFDDYSFQTYIHEIGHALGLGHAGPYNGAATYPKDAVYVNDSWQSSIMSYFSQAENTTVKASFAYAITPMAADIIAVQDMYGRAKDTRLGDTTYGFKDTTGEARLQFVKFDTPTTLTLVDSGGNDTLDLSGFDGRQVLNLNDKTFSSFGGGTGNLGIARGTMIENAVGGDGNDRLIGNELSNVLTGGDGRDKFIFAGTDFGDDIVRDFELGVDVLAFRRGLDFEDFTLSETKGGLLLDLDTGQDSGTILFAGLSIEDVNAHGWLV